MEVDVVSPLRGSEVVSTTTGNELLSITDAAVFSVSKEPHYSRETNIAYQGFTGDTLNLSNKTDMSRTNIYPEPTQANSIDFMPQDDSVLSRRSVMSDRSIEQSTFLKGNAQKVKVPAKKLREIKSPFDAHVQSNFDGSMVKDSSDSTFKESPGRKSMVEQVELSSTFGSTGAAISNRIAVEKHISPPQLRPYPESPYASAPNTLGRSGKMIDTVTGEGTDSGFVTQNIQVIREVQGETQSQNTSSGEMSSIDEYTHGDRVITANHGEGDYSQPEIVTVNQGSFARSGDCTPQANTSFNSDRTTQSGQTQESASSLQQRFDRIAPPLLQQGSLQGSSADTSTNSTSPKDQVHIEQFYLDDKRKLLKNKFVKRQVGGPVKKKVEVKQVQHPATNAQFTTKDKPGVTTQAGQTDPVSTAAVAAASAVAATQPFLKLQQDLEYRMAQVLDKLVASETGKQQAVKGVDEETKKKLEELEYNLKDITQRRLDFLEEAQKQQMNWQAQMLSHGGPVQISAPQQFDSAPIQYTHQEHTPIKQIKSRHSTSPIRSKSKSRNRSRSPRTPVRTKDVSVLSTPAPRQRPPRPLEKSPTGRRSPKSKAGTGAFLAEILAQTESPKLSPHRTSPTRLNYSIDRREASPTVKRAQSLLHELADLRDETHNALQGDLFERTSLKLSGPAPLDSYLKKSDDAPPTSPYPVRRKGDAPPLVNNFMDARETLKELQEKRGYLEANLDAILRARQESEVYAAIDTLTQGSMAERLRIRKLVDAHITKMSYTMESEVMDELMRMEEKKKMSFLIPERDTTSSKVKGTTTSRYGYKNKVIAQSKVDSGLRRAKQLAEMRIAALGKENVPRPLPKVKKSDPMENSRYVERVYGKTRPQGSRTELKHQPYPHFKNEKPKPKPGVRPTHTIQGVQMSTAKTQTKSGAVHAAVPSAVPPGTQLSPNSASSMPMAVPLGVPRRIGTIPNVHIPPVTEAPSPIATLHPKVTSTPITPAVPRENVGMITLRDEEAEKEEQRRNRKLQLETKVLPSVNVDGKRAPKLGIVDITPIDIDTDPSLNDDILPRKHHTVTAGRTFSPARASSPTRAASPSRGSPTRSPSKERGGGMISPSLQKFVKDAQEELHQAIEKSYGDDTFEDADETKTDEIEGSPIALPGHARPPAEAYHGPQFPPEAPRMREQKREPIAEEELIFAQRQRDVLIHKANDWVEQELLAQVINEVYTSKNAPKPRRETVPHATPLPKRTKNRAYEQVVASPDLSQASGHDSLIAEALGQEGMQVFVDAGAEVDESLVNALIKEVLEERIQSMAGQKTSRDNEGMPRVPKRQPATRIAVRPAPAVVTPVVTDKKEWQSVVRKARAPSPPVQMPDTPVATPEPTPTGSPRASPPTQRVDTPPETPDWTPEPSLAEPLRVPVLRVRRDTYESEPEEIVQEYEPRSRQEPNVERHSITTPVDTPPGTPVDMRARTPSPSIKEDDYTPIPSEVELDNTPTSTRQPSPEPSVHEPEPVEVVSHGIQTTPPPAEPTPRTPPSSGSVTEEETETSSWATQTETGLDQISEGQWLLSTKSDGEVAGPAMNPVWRERLREKVILTARSNDDTFNEAADLDKDPQTHRSHSEGEFIAPHGVHVQDNPYLAVAQMQPVTPLYPQQPVHRIATDKSVGEVSFTDRAALLEQAQNLAHGIAAPKRKGKKGRHDYESPGELLDGTASSAAATSSDDNQDRAVSKSKHHHRGVVGGKGDASEYRPSAPPRRGSTPSPPPVRTITVQPSSSEGDEHAADTVDGRVSDEAKQSASDKEDSPRQPAITRNSLGSMNGSREGSLNGSGRHPSSGPIHSASPQKSQGRRYRAGSSLMGGPSAGGRPGGISPGGRTPSPDKRGRRSYELRHSREEYHATLSDASFTQTSDRINIDALLASKDYLQRTESDLASTADLRHFRSTDFSRKSGTFGYGSGELERRISLELPEAQAPAPAVDDYAARTFMMGTMGSTSDMSLQEGLTQTLEREESEKLLSHTTDIESDMKHSSKYPDSLEGTGNGGTRDSADFMRGTRQVSLTLPSAAEEEYDDHDDQDASTLSNV